MGRLLPMQGVENVQRHDADCYRTDSTSTRSVRTPFPWVAPNPVARRTVFPANCGRDRASAGEEFHYAGRRFRIHESGYGREWRAFWP